MVRAQKKMLQRFEKTNEMLTNVNTLSQTRLERATTDFKKHTALVVDTNQAGKSHDRLQKTHCA